MYNIMYWHLTLTIDISIREYVPITFFYLKVIFWNYANCMCNTIHFPLAIGGDPWIHLTKGQ